jgi:four helix bundle protein
MQTSNIAAEKAYAFAIRIVHLADYLQSEKREYVLSRQILRSGTSIGANLEEAIGAQSKADFVAKLSISFKEARETSYWLRLLKDTHKIEARLAASLLSDVLEIRKILAKSLLSAKQNIKKAKNTTP